MSIYRPSQPEDLPPATYYATPTASYLPGRARPSSALIVADIVGLIGVILSSVSLFLHGWVHAQIVFASPGRVGQILQSFGVDADRELKRIADREINATIPPTLWQYQGHYVQFVFALLVLTGVLLLVALCFARIRVVAQMLALVAGLGAVGVIVVALVRLRDRSASLPERVAQAALQSPVVNRVFNATTGKPVLTGGPGWPLYAAAVGLVLVLLGALLGLIFAFTRSSQR